MTDLVPADEIEGIVGYKRRPFLHLGRAVSYTKTFYILHSYRCRRMTPDLMISGGTEQKTFLCG
jgi:hypothetical protein